MSCIVLTSNEMFIRMLQGLKPHTQSDNGGASKAALFQNLLTADELDAAPFRNLLTGDAHRSRPFSKLTTRWRIRCRPLSKTYNLRRAEFRSVQKQSKQIKSYCNAACCLIHAS